jgi:hypothetical protein
MEIMFLQTADDLVYREILDASARANIAFCRRHNIVYESYCGVKAGASPWMATYNRIFMLNEVLDRGFAGWAIFIDADAFIADMDFDFRRYLAQNAAYCLIGTTGGSATPWDINAGVLFINLGDPEGHVFVREWQKQFYDKVPQSYLADESSVWDEYPNDQTLMYEVLKSNPRLLIKTKREDSANYNYVDGRVIRQALRASFRDLRSRTNWVREQVGMVLGSAAASEQYVDLTAIANKLGCDKGDQVGNAHQYTEIYKFLFEEFRFESLECLEVGLLQGGPEVGGSADRLVHDAPSIRMWLEYFPNATCHGVDIADFSPIKLDRFQFHRCDIGAPSDRARLRDQLPPLRFVVDDGSHASYHQQAAFSTLFPLVEPGGYYIIENLHWQPKNLEETLPECALTRDVFFKFTWSRLLDIRFLTHADKLSLGSQIMRTHFVRDRDATIKMVVLQKLR